MATLTRQGEEIPVTAALALDVGKTIVEDAAIKIAVDHLLRISTEEATLDFLVVLILPAIVLDRMGVFD